MAIRQRAGQGFGLVAVVLKHGLHPLHLALRIKRCNAQTAIALEPPRLGLNLRLLLGVSHGQSLVGDQLHAFFALLFHAHKRQEQRDAMRADLALSEERYAIAISGAADGLWDWGVNINQTISWDWSLTALPGGATSLALLDTDGDGIPGIAFTSGPFLGFTMAIEGIASPVPLPAAVWLFGSGLLLGLIGISRRKKTI